MTRSVSTPNGPREADRVRWRAYWKAQDQPWRTEPEITNERQRFLAERRALAPNTDEGVYPFKGIKLSRADVEWLLATHQAAKLEGGRGSTRWQIPTGLDLRGADLRKVNLSYLPLYGMRGGLTLEEWLSTDEEQREQAHTHLEHANLHGAHLERAVLLGAVLARANLRAAHLTGADCSEAHLEHALLHQAHLEGASLYKAHLEGAELIDAHLEGANLQEASLRHADLSLVVLAGANLKGAHLEGASFRGAHLEGTAFPEQEQERVSRSVDRFPTILLPADLRGAAFDTASDLYGVSLGDDAFGYVRMADVRWGNAILSVVAWSHVSMLGDERKARQPQTEEGHPKSLRQRLAEYETAIRANSQLALVLRGQGLGGQAARFVYRTQLLRRQILWWQTWWGRGESAEDVAPRVGLWGRAQNLGSWFFSCLLDLLSGYGYKLSRCFVAYILAIVGFAVAHYLVALFVEPPPLSWLQAFAMSIQSLHGRVFAFRPGDAQQVVNTAEAVVGLLIEALLVAIITPRILGLDR